MTEPAAHIAATRTAYDTVARNYAEQLAQSLDELPVDRAVLALFAELVDGPALDVGCGPGHVTAHLADRRVDLRGLDLSPEMVAQARARHRGIRFEVGSMLGLPDADASLGGIVAWYSTIHLPPAHLPEAFAEFHRVLKPGGALALAFQVGDEVRHIEQGYGHAVSIDAYRRQPDDVWRLLEAAGFARHSTTVREPGPTETVQQAYLVARR